MSYTVRVKEEISSHDCTKSELIAELSGYIRNNGVIKNEKIVMTTENKMIVKRLKDSFQVLYNREIKSKIISNVNFSKRELYQIIIENEPNNVLQNLGLFDQNNHYIETVPNYIVGANEEIRAYLRGTFLAIGSINDPKTSRYHMELLVLHPKEAVFIQKYL